MFDDFSVTVDLTDPAVPIVGVAGEVDMATAPALCQQFADLAKELPAAIVVDLTDVAYLGSSGISALIGLREQLVDYDARLVVIAVFPMTLRLFEIVGAYGLFTVVASRVEAAHALRPLVGEPTP